MKRRTLSSWATFGYKYLFPLAWITVFGLGVFGILTPVRTNVDGGPAPDLTRWQVVGLWVLSSAFIIWFSGRLKTIQVDDSALYVSNYFSEVRIALTDVETISQSFRTKPKTITIHFRTETAVGARVVFLPRFRFHWGNSHPIVAELTELCDKAATAA